MTEKINESDAGHEHTVDQLPRLLGVEDGVIMCWSCRRKWRLPADGRLDDANFAYLCQHADLHVRTHHKRPHQRWTGTGLTGR